MGKFREIVEKKIRALKVLPTLPRGSVNPDLLIGSGCVTSMVASYIGRCAIRGACRKV